MCSVSRSLVSGNFLEVAWFICEGILLYSALTLTVQTGVEFEVCFMRYGESVTVCMATCSSSHLRKMDRE